MMFYECPMGTNTPEDIVDKFNIREIVEYDRYCRDYNHYDEMRSLYSDDASVGVSWTKGGINNYVEGSRVNNAKAPAKHKIFDVIIWKHGNRAIAESIQSIQIRCPLEGDVVDLATLMRKHYRLEKREGQWKIVSAEPIYEKDTMFSAYADGTFCPDREELASLRPSYANLMYRRMKYGGHPDAACAGEDKPETVEKLYKESSVWLGVMKE